MEISNVPDRSVFEIYPGTTFEVAFAVRNIATGELDDLTGSTITSNSSVDISQALSFGEVGYVNMKITPTLSSQFPQKMPFDIKLVNPDGSIDLIAYGDFRIKKGR